MNPLKPLQVLPRVAGGRAAPIALISVLCFGMPVQAKDEPRHELGTYDGVVAQWWVIQELKEQFRADWSFENTTDQPVEFTYSIAFECSDSPGRSWLMGEKLKPKEKKGGQWRGMTSYPCKGTPPTSARLETFKFKGLSAVSCDPSGVVIEVRLTSTGALGVIHITGEKERLTLSRQTLLALRLAKEGLIKDGHPRKPAPPGPALLVNPDGKGEPVPVSVSYLLEAFCGPKPSLPDSLRNAFFENLKGTLQRATQRHCEKEPDPASCEEEARKRTQLAGGVRD